MVTLVNVVREHAATSLALVSTLDSMPIEVATVVDVSKVVHDPIDALALLRIFVVAVVPLVDGCGSVYELPLLPQGTIAAVPRGVAEIAELGPAPTSMSGCQDEPGQLRMGYAL